MTLHSSYKDEDYAVVVSQVTADDTDMNVYMKRACLNALVGNEKDDFNGWASDDELHFDADNVMSDLTSNDMAAIAGQIRSSMGSIMAGLVASVVVIFAIVIYLLSKTVMERSSHAMSRLKVFGYRNGELSRVYVRAITVSVVVSLLVSIPLISAACGALFDVGLMDYDIAFKLSVPWDVFAEYVLMGLVCYAVVALANRWHLSRVPLALALKGQD